MGSIEKDFKLFAKDKLNLSSLLIDDINIKDYELDDLRRLIGHVQQDVFIFFG